MPGFAGIIGPRIFDPATTSDLGSMIRCLTRESADITGEWRHKPLALEVAAVCLPGCAPRGWPVWNSRHDIALIFFGDVQAIVGSSSRGQDSDRSPDGRLAALLDLYEERGAGFIADLNGSFHGLIVDLREQTVILFNDRYGLSRVYYQQSTGGLLFATEAKSLLAVLPASRRFDERGLAEFFSIGCVLQNRSLFNGISLLPPGSLWTFHRDGRILKRRYFDPTVWEQQSPLDAAAYGERLREVFSRITPRYLQGNDRVAMSLTGGLDSRAILAWARPGPGSLPCYTFGGPYRDCADVRIARRLAEISGQHHSILRIGKGFFGDFAALAKETVHLSDGTMDVSGAVELYVNRQARQIAPVRLTGNYGSEILRSNVAFRPGRPDPSLFTPEFRRRMDEAAETYRDEAACNRLSFIAFKQVPWHHYARLSVEKSQLTPRSPYLDNEVVALAYRAPPELATSAGPLLDLIAAGNPTLGRVGTDRALRRSALPVVTKLARAWQEFTAKAEYACDYGMPPWLTPVDRTLGGLKWDRLFLGRHKFYHFRTWYRHELAAHLRECNTGTGNACYQDGTVGRIIGGHLSGRSNHTLDLHKLLTVQLIDRLFLHES
jgi:asparagine synthase (glutamine-hydrolysing)